MEDLLTLPQAQTSESPELTAAMLELDQSSEDDSDSEMDSKVDLDADGSRLGPTEAPVKSLRESKPVIRSGAQRSLAVCWSDGINRGLAVTRFEPILRVINESPMER